MGARGERATERGLAFSCCSDETGGEAFGEMDCGGPSASVQVTTGPTLEEAAKLGSEADRLRCTSAAVRAFDQESYDGTTCWRNVGDASAPESHGTAPALGNVVKEAGAQEEAGGLIQATEGCVARTHELVVTLIRGGSGSEL